MILALSVPSIVSALANDGTFSASGNQLIPVKETEVSVKKEILKLTRKGSEMIVDVYYEFYNPTSSPKTLLVGFEAPSPDNPDYVDEKLIYKQQPYISGFNVIMNGKKLKYDVAIVPLDESFKDGKPNALSAEKINQLKAVEDPEYYDFNYVYYFDAVFKPGVNVVKHTYEYRMSHSVDYQFFFPYALTPACRWANGQIDDFTLIVDMGAFASYDIPATFFKQDDKWIIHGVGGLCYDSEYEEMMSYNVRSGYVEFKKKNFKPEGDLAVRRRNSPLPQCCPDAAVDLYLWEFRNLGFDHPESWEEWWNEYEITAEDARILKNIPFAYRGNVFKSADLKSYFEKAAWYFPDPSYVPDMNTLTPGEQKWVLYWTNYKPKAN